MNNKEAGAAGEAGTVTFLEARGYRVVDVNVRPEGGLARGEIDVIAWDGPCLVFCEVKTRRTGAGAQGTPGEAVDARKRLQLTRLAQVYLAHHALDDVDCRFDVVEVVQAPPRPPRFRLVRDAFSASE